MRKTLSSIVLAASLAFSGSALAGVKSAMDDLGKDMKKVGEETVDMIENVNVFDEDSASNDMIVGSAKTIAGLGKAALTFETDLLKSGAKEFGRGVADLAKDTYSLTKAVAETAYDALFVLDENTPAYDFWSSVVTKLDEAVAFVDEKGFKLTADKLDELFNDDPVMAFVLTSTLRSLGDAVYATWDLGKTLFIAAPFRIAQSLAKEVYLFAKGFATGAYKNPLDVIKAVGKGILNILSTIGQQVVRVFEKAAKAFKEIAEVFIGEGGSKLLRVLEFIFKDIPNAIISAGSAIFKAIFCGGKKKKNDDAKQSPKQNPAQQK